MLKLPLEELKILYTKHLILKEFLINDVSLYILSLCFLYRKQIAFDLYNNKDHKKALPLLESLEDRYINGIVAYRIGYCHENHNYYYYYAYNILKNKKDLSSKELYYMGCMYKDGKGTEKNSEKAIACYKLSNHSKAFVQLGCAYRDGILNVIINNETAVMYFEKALNSSNGQCHLAYMLEHGYGILLNNNRSKELYISAAKGGNIYAIERCKYKGWI